MFKEQKGITLIALVITIIVLLILAGVTIAMLSGNDSTPARANQAAIKDAIAGGKDAVAMKVIDVMQEYYTSTYVNSAGTTAAADAAVTYLQSHVTGVTANGVTIGAPSALAGETGAKSFTITVTSTKDTSKVATGTISGNGKITWTDPTF